MNLHFNQITVIMKAILLFCALTLVSCSSIKIQNPQNWNSDEILQRLHAKEENERIQQHANRITIIQDSMITIMDRP